MFSKEKSHVATMTSTNGGGEAKKKIVSMNKS